MTTFVDTGVLFAAAYRRDRKHTRGATILRGLAMERPFCTDHVLIEVWSLLHARSGWEAAMAFWTGVRDSALFVEPVGIADLERAEAIANAFRDQELDIVDCTSFAVMERVGCHRAATFDRDFAVYRYGPRRNKAFEIVR